MNREMLHWILAAVIPMTTVATAVHAEPPMGTAFTYQGRLTDSGSPANGEYELAVDLYDDAVDGNRVAPTLEIPGVEVINGLFTVPLDFGGAPFQGGARWMEIGVRPRGGSEYVRLFPRQELTPAPYALYAGVAGSVLGGGGTCLWQQSGSKIYYNTGNVGIGTTNPLSLLVVEKSLENNIEPMAIFRTTGSNSTAAIQFQNADGNRFSLGITKGNELALGYNANVPLAGDLLCITAAGDVGIGTTSPATRLHINGTARMSGFQLGTSATAGHVLTADASGVGTWQAPTGGGESLWQESGSNIYYDIGNVGIGTTSPGQKLDIGKTTDSTNYLRLASTASGYSGIHFYDGESGYSGMFQYAHSGDYMRFYTRSGASVGERMRITSTGDIGIGTTSPAAKLHVNGTTRMNGFQLGSSATAGHVLTADANGIGTWQAPAASGGFDLPYDGSASSSTATFKVTNTHATSGSGVYGVGAEYGVRGQSSGSGVYGFSAAGSGVQGNTNTGIGVEARSFSGGTAMYAKGNGTTVNAPAAYIENSNSGGISVFSTCSSTDSNAVIVNKGTGDLIRGFSGSTGGDLVFRVANDGTTSVAVLAITGGSDLAEQFDVGGAAKPGMVVMIDPDNPGKLCLARGTYNRCVAGVISGANGVGTGMVLSNLSGEIDTQPVALSGRVWVYCDAADKAIEPGDMLTTAARAGHAMAVTDFGQAHGAVLGKAMSKLAKSETGLVLALVNLQ